MYQPKKKSVKMASTLRKQELPKPQSSYSHGNRRHWNMWCWCENGTNWCLKLKIRNMKWGRRGRRDSFRDQYPCNLDVERLGTKDKDEYKMVNSSYIFHWFFVCVFQSNLVHKNAHVPCHKPTSNVPSEQSNILFPLILVLFL